MTQQVINIGSAPDDSTGDQLRISFDKCNGNFTELYQGVAASAPIGNAIEYQFNNNTTEPPASGEIRFNLAPTATTKLWVSQTTVSGTNIKQFLSAATTGAKLVLQDKNDNTNYVKFDVTSAPIDKTTYWEASVTVTASGGNLPNARILAAVTAAVGVPEAPTDGQQYARQDASWTVAGGGGGAGGSAQYTFSTNTSAPPSSGQIRFNNAAVASATIVWINNITSGGTDLKRYFETLSIGTKLYIQDESDSSQYAKYQVASAPVDHTSYWEFPATYLASGGALNNQQRAALIVQPPPAAAAGAIGPPQGRLTLQSATPVMITTQAAKTTIYYSPYVGNMVPIYNGTSMVMTAFTELNVATTDTTKNPTAVGVSKVNDWFVWSDAGTLRLGHGPDWTNDTTRSAGTALTMVNGILLNNASITNGPAASRGTYVGTTRSNASSQLDWIYGGQSAGGTAAFFGVWNAYNRLRVATSVRDSTGTWTYAGVGRPANNSVNNRISFVVGLNENAISAVYSIVAFAGASSDISFGIGVDSTTVMADHITYALAAASTHAHVFPLEMLPGIGFHFLQAMEYSITTINVATMVGVNTGSQTQSLQAAIWM